MATFNKFDCIVKDLAEGNHNWSDTAGTGHTLRFLICNVVPNVGDTLVDTTTTTCEVHSVGSAVEVTAFTGYTKKGPEIVWGSSSQTNGAYKLCASANVVITNTSGSASPSFQYAVAYNDEAKTTATRPPIGWWNYGSSIQLQNNETFTWDSNESTGWMTLTIS